MLFQANTFLGMLLIFILITIAAMFYNTKNKIVFYTEKMMAFPNQKLIVLEEKGKQRVLNGLSKWAKIKHTLVETR